MESTGLDTAEPAGNRMTPAKVELGRYLFYDKRLSADHTMACATCHQQARAFTAAIFDLNLDGDEQFYHGKLIDRGPPG